MKKILNTLYINSPDRYLGLEGENVVVYCEEEVIGRVPLHNLESIITYGYTGASPALLGSCARRNIPVCFCSTSGKLLARVTGPRQGNVLLRREQYRVADNEVKCLEIARNMIIGKVFNSRWVIERTIRDHGLVVNQERLQVISKQLQQSLGEIKSCADLETLRGYEGEAANRYFSVFNEMILQQKEEFEFCGRTRRPPLDKVNALLSFTYSLLTSMCAGALEMVGLDPYVGYLHTDRPGRQSLALDLVEEFRSVYADRFVLTIINKKMINGDDLQQMADGAVILTDEGRRKLFTAWQDKKKQTIIHPFLDEKVEWGMLPYVQALLLSRYIRGDLDAYPPFLWK